ALTNPSWTTLQVGWQVACAAWSGSSPLEGEQLDPRTRFQVEALSLLLPLRSDELRSALQSSRVGSSRPVALELLEALASVGWHAAKGPLREGPFEIHAAAGSQAFCLMPEEAYFRQPSSQAAFRLIEEVTGQPEGLELCLERSAELRLLQCRGWQVTPVPFQTWRRLSAAGRRSLVLEAAGRPPMEAARQEAAALEEGRL
ncbi:unnamed protein product, partial [Polarella glacialis]